MTITDPQAQWDAEDSTAFRARLRQLQHAVSDCRERESAARSAFATASRDRRDAELKLRSYLEEDLVGLPLFDRRPDPKPEPSAPAPEPAAPELPWDDYALTDPGARVVADLTPALGARCRLSMHADGCYAAIFDTLSFGNWDSPSLRPEEYSPTADEIAAAASDATGLPFRAGDAGDLPGGRLFYLRLDLADALHPEPWRFATISTLIAGPIPKLLFKQGIEYLGDLAARIEAGPPLTDAKGITANGAATLLDGLRTWWLTTRQGEAGERPDWLAPWPKEMLPRLIDRPDVVDGPDDDEDDADSVR